MEQMLNSLGQAVVAGRELAETKTKLDSECKAFLAEKQVLAWILRDCAPEFEGMDIPEIVDCIEGTPVYGKIPVDKDMTAKYAPEKITGMPNEDTSVSEGKVDYDVRFKARSMQDGVPTDLIINVEAQNAFKPGYSLVTRGIYYCGRMISAQKHTEFSHSQYQNLKKVHSIWICINPDKGWEGSVTTYTLDEHNLVGNVKSKKKDYDKVQVTLLCLDGKPTNKVDAVGMLDTAFSNSLTAEQKLERLESMYNMQVTETLERRLNEMCNYSDGVYDAGIEKGIKQGRDEAIVGTVSILKRMGTATAEIIKQLVIQFGLSKDEAADYVADAK